MALFAKGIKGLGHEKVMGRRRVPYPPTRIRAFIFVFLVEFLIVVQSVGGRYLGKAHLCTALWESSKIDDQDKGRWCFLFLPRERDRHRWEEYDVMTGSI